MPWRWDSRERRRDSRERDLERELQSHLDLETEEQRDAGLKAEDASYAARRALGNAALIKEDTREAWGGASLERLWHDLRYAARLFARSPGFVAVAAVSIGLGIGGNAAMFGIVNALLIRPLPYQQPDRLLRITSVYPKAALVLFQERSRTMDVASASPGSEGNLDVPGRAARVRASAVSDNLFSVLQSPARWGRVFASGDSRPGMDRLIVLSDALWKTEFGGDPRAVGAVVTLDGVARRVVGIMPPGFSYPNAAVQCWVPARLDASNMEDYWGSEYVPFIARLRPGAAILQARAEVRSITAELNTMFPFPMPRNWNGDATAIPLQADLVSGIRGKLAVLFSAVALVLVIACANVSGLLLSRAGTRRRELALRTALGAARLRIVRQLLTECLLLSALGAAFGLLLGRVALSVFKSVLPPGTPGLAGLAMDWQVLAFAAALAIASGLTFGIVPALGASRVDLVESMKTGSARTTARAGSRLRDWLVAGEICLTVLLVVSAGLLLKSLYSMLRVNPGFGAERVLTMRLSPERSFCERRESCIALYERLVDRTKNLPGTLAVAAANTVPLDGLAPDLPYDVEDHPKSADFPSPMFWNGAVTPAYFDILGIRLLEGRLFDARDGPRSAGVAVITASTARRFWPNQSAVGKHIKPVWDPQWRTVIGVVADVRQFNLAGRTPDSLSGAVYLPYPQSVQGDHRIPAVMTLVVKTNAPPERVASELRQIARELSPNAPSGEVTALREIVSASTADFRSTIWVFVSFAAAALVLASVGVYGLVSHSVAQRTYEIGLRVAVGATRQDVLAMVLAQIARLTLLGVGSGVVASLALTRFLAGLLFGVGATDPGTYAVVCAAVIGAAGLASCLPAWKAANLDAVTALRAE